MTVTIRVNLAYVLAALAVVLAAVIALQFPEIKRYLKMETM
jgi:uncharacterized protein (UPF0333 family)